MPIFDPGVYPAVIVQWETKAGEHVGYKTNFQLTDGPFKGRYISDYLILQHANETAQKIGFGKICDIAFAAGVSEWENENSLASLLIGKEILLDVIKGKDSRDGSDQNRIKTAYTLAGDNRSGHKMRASAKPVKKFIGSDDDVFPG